MRLKSFFATLFLTASLPLFSQVVPSATEGGLSLSVGAGLSGYNPDLGSGRMYGGTLWIDYTLNRAPSLLHGVGIEVEARDISLDRSSSERNVREDAAGGGVTYTWRHFRNLRPYAKVILGFGNADYETRGLVRRNDSRTITCPGGGVEFRAFRKVWARADYEYQIWPDFFKNTTPAGFLDPQGLTVGVMYHFSHEQRAR
ncbi:MAG: outer membrane beta-barrel protein [Terracidiphilus sp.]|jgi:hypothetical protein